MTNPQLTHIEFLLDRSGSMESIVESIQAGFNNFIDEQRKVAGGCSVSLAQFDDEYEVVFSALPIAQVRPLKLEPRGMTALLDAIGRSIISLGDRLAALPEDERPGAVIVAIMTDGYENASKEFSHAKIRSMIEHQESVYNWQFLYMGANQDAIEEGAKMGIRADQALTYDVGHADTTYQVASAAVGRYREAVFQGAPLQEARDAGAFTDAERAQANGDKAE